VWRNSASLPAPTERRASGEKFVNVFVLCTGRCGSTTFAKACSHITNYTASHESRHGMAGNTRLDYPPNHIEVENRLSWFLGRLDERFGNSAFYVHLTRNPDEVAESFAARWDMGIMLAYRMGISPTTQNPKIEPIALASDLVRTVTSNIDLFLRDKTSKMAMQLENLKDQFPIFFDRIGAQGNLNLALDELGVRYNARQG
jgi:hypothetical protein